MYALYFTATTATISSAEDEPYAQEAKESLRTKLVGKPVRVTIDYERDVPQGDGPPVRRSFATVEVGKGAKARNIAAVLTAEGLLTVVRHRQDEQRSGCYEELLAAEQEARDGKAKLFVQNFSLKFLRRTLRRALLVTLFQRFLRIHQLLSSLLVARLC
jgi:endonuclease YncB( thermonuclease family)